MDTGLMGRNTSEFFIRFGQKVRDFIALVFLLLAYHWYDVFCYAVSNIFSLATAMSIMFVVLFSLSTLFVYTHQILDTRYSWDILGLKKLNHLRGESHISEYRICKRITKQVLNRGYWWILIPGSVIIGPPIVTILLRRQNNLSQNLFYITLGTTLSVTFWVLIWAGIGLVTWDQYVRPFLASLF